MSEEVDFTDFTLKIYKNFKEHEQNVKSLCVAKSIMRLSDFNNTAQNELQAIKSETTPSKERGTVGDYMELFKVFDEYPANIQKPKKRELQRVNSMLLKGNAHDATTCITTAINNSATSLHLSKLEDHRSATKIYNDFKQFQRKLRQAQGESDLQNEQYTSKLRQLQHFAQQLEKLVPTGDGLKEAFTAEEEQKLNAIATNMEQLNFVRMNNCLFTGPTDGAHMARLEKLVDILSYTLMQISCFNV